MTKADIAARIQLTTGLCRQDSIAMLESVLSILKDSLAAGETVKISGFGNFVVGRKAPRKGYNPKTRKSMTIAARNVLTFKSSHVLRKAINGRTACDKQEDRHKPLEPQQKVTGWQPSGMFHRHAASTLVNQIPAGSKQLSL